MKRLIVLFIFLSGCDQEQCWASNDECLLEPEPGPCKASIPKYYFDQQKGECTIFYWGGCDGTAPFEMRADCEAACLCATG